MNNQQQVDSFLSHYDDLYRFEDIDAGMRRGAEAEVDTHFCDDEELLDADYCVGGGVNINQQTRYKYILPSQFLIILIDI